MITRKLNIFSILSDNSSTFLLGARGVGKSVLSKLYLESKDSSILIDLLKSEEYRRYLLNPELLRQELESQANKTEGITRVLIDEVQRVPMILNEVHSVLSNFPKKFQFILTGSSARKLKKKGVNLLAGRALTLYLHPLSYCEIENFDLTTALQFGTLPDVYLNKSNRGRKLKAYVETYLKEEIREEALVRKIEAYYKFVELAAQYNGATVNYKKIADKIGTSSQTIKEYYSILSDTLLTIKIPAWSYSVKKQIVSSAKYYFFDCGVLNAINGETSTELKESSYRFGDLFENFLICEINKLNQYMDTNYKLYHWRTNAGQEVDLILSRSPKDTPIAIEIKSSKKVEKRELSALRAFKADNPNSKPICFCRTPRSYQIDDIEILPWQEGLEQLFF